MNMETRQFIEDHLAAMCHGAFHLHVKRPGIFQVSLPIYYEDGDALEMFVEMTSDKRFRLSDFGMTAMRLSYDYELDSPNKEDIFRQIVVKNKLQEKDGIVFTDVAPDEIYPGLLQLASGISKISSMKYFRKEVVQSMFYETVSSFITENLAKFDPQKNFQPIPGREEIEVDFLIQTPVRPLFIYPVKNSDKAKSVTINCLFLQKEQVHFNSVIILESVDGISRKDQINLMNAVDKQFASFDAFTNNIEAYIARESMIVSH